MKEDSEKIESIEKVAMKRISDMDDNEDLERIQVCLPEKILKTLKDFAYEQEMSRGAVIRQALRDYFAKIENPSAINPEQKISDETLTDLLQQCQTYFGGFETVGDEGFFALAEATKLKLKNLTDTQFLEVAEKLKTGYKGFLSAPSIDEFLEYVKKLEPTSDQLKFLQTVLEHDLSWTLDKPTDNLKTLLKEIDEKTKEE